MTESRKACAILFSGGTDSTCAAAICAETFSELHLLTFYERATQDSPVPIENVERLRKHFPDRRIFHKTVSTDTLVQKLSYERYLRNLLTHRFYLLSTPGFSSLSWHLRMIAYCIQNGIHHVFDGMTRELMHLPGHMTEVRTIFTELYASFGISFSSPVIDWDVPPDQRFMDRLIVDRHGFVASEEVARPERTTGRYLYEKGIFPHPNVKGSLFDQRMQHDCYPFVLFNVFVFWWALAVSSETKFRGRMASLFKEKCAIGGHWIRQALQDEAACRSLLAEPQDV